MRLTLTRERSTTHMPGGSPGGGPTAMKMLLKRACPSQGAGGSCPTDPDELRSRMLVAVLDADVAEYNDRRRSSRSCTGQDGAGDGECGQRCAADGTSLPVGRPGRDLVSHTGWSVPRSEWGRSLLPHPQGPVPERAEPSSPVPGAGPDPVLPLCIPARPMSTRWSFRPRPR